MTSNSIFGCAPYESNHIACVGKNGYIDLMTYADGFLDGAKNIIYCMRVSDQNRDVEELKSTDDTIIYPICFNIRHSIELYLKFIVEHLKVMLDHNKNHTFKIDEHFTKKTHAISTLWGKINDFSNAVDNRLATHINQLDDYMTQWANIDDTSQTFRYPFSNDSKRHLADISGIDIMYLWTQCEEQHKKLKQFAYFIIFLEQEYQYKTSIKNLSRYSLYCLAKKLPQYDTWKETLTKEVKESLKQNFRISSNTLSSTIKKILNNYEFSRIIGHKKTLLNASLKDVLTVVTVFLEHFPYDEDKSVTITNLADEPSIEEVFNQLEESTKIDKKIKLILEKYTEEELYDMLVLMYLGRSDMFHLNISENYQITLSQKRVEITDKQEIINKMLEKNRSTAIFILKELILLGFDKKILENKELLNMLSKSERESLEVQKMPSYKKLLGYEEQ